MEKGPPSRPGTSERRQKILSAALRCFAEQGYEATTLGQIRERSGSSTGSIYHLFASKEEIAGAVYLDGLRSYQEGLLEALAQRKTAEATVRTCVEHYLGWVEADERLGRFILHTRQAELVPAVKEELRAMNRAFFGALAEILDRHVRAGAIKAMPRELFYAIVMGPAHEYLRTWLSGRRKVSLREASRMLAGAAWDAVRSQDARPRG